jgi:hypothetical protein
MVSRTSRLSGMQPCKFRVADERGCGGGGRFFVIVIVENGVRLKLNIVDTPGYGDQINNEGCWEPIVRYVRIVTWNLSPHPNDYDTNRVGYTYG